MDPVASGLLQSKRAVVDCSSLNDASRGFFFADESLVPDALHVLGSVGLGDNVESTASSTAGTDRNEQSLVECARSQPPSESAGPLLLPHGLAANPRSNSPWLLRPKRSSRASLLAPPCAGDVEISGYTFLAAPPLPLSESPPPSVREPPSSAARSGKTPLPDQPDDPTPCQPGRLSSSHAQSNRAPSIIEDALMIGMRHQIDSLDEKVRMQLGLFQEQSERKADAAFTWIEERMNVVMLELDQKLTCFGDDLQLQTRRIDLLDGRLWEWRDQMEGDFRSRLTESERQLNLISSVSRQTAAVVEELQDAYVHQVKGLDCSREDHSSRLEKTGQALLNFHARIEVLEGKLAQAQPRVSAPVMDQELAFTSGKVESALRSAHDLRADLDAQKDRMEQERAERMDSTEQIRQVAQNQIDAAAAAKARHESLDEKLEMMSRRLRDQECAHEDLREAQEQFFTDARQALASASLRATQSQGQSPGPGAEAQPAQPAPAPAPAAKAQEAPEDLVSRATAECLARLERSEASILRQMDEHSRRLEDRLHDATMLDVQKLMAVRDHVVHLVGEKASAPAPAVEHGNARGRPGGAPGEANDPGRPSRLRPL